MAKESILTGKRNPDIALESITLGQLLDIWVEEDLKTGSMSNGTVELYQNVVKVIKRYPICERKLSTITSEDLQEFIDHITTENSYAKKPYTILNHAFRLAVFPKRYISDNPMQYVILHRRNAEADIFGTDIETESGTTTLTYETFMELTKYLEDHHPVAVLPVQIAYYTGLRIGEVIGLTWNDINLDEQYLTVRRSVTYDTVRHKLQIGTTKRSKIRIVDYGDDLAKILAASRNRRIENKAEYGESYHSCFYRKVIEKNRTYYEYYHLDKREAVPDDFHEIDFVCRNENGTLVRPGMIKTMCWHLAKKHPEFEGFHFHVLRHTYTTNLLANGAMPKDVQELLGHSSLSTTMNIYAHATRESKRVAARLLDKSI